MKLLHRKSVTCEFRNLLTDSVHEFTSLQLLAPRVNSLGRRGADSWNSDCEEGMALQACKSGDLPNPLPGSQSRASGDCSAISRQSGERKQLKAVETGGRGEVSREWRLASEWSIEKTTNAVEMDSDDDEWRP